MGVQRFKVQHKVQVLVAVVPRAQMEEQAVTTQNMVAGVAEPQTKPMMVVKAEGQSSAVLEAAVGAVLVAMLVVTAEHGENTPLVDKTIMVRQEAEPPVPVRVVVLDVETAAVAEVLMQAVLVGQAAQEELPQAQAVAEANHRTVQAVVQAD